MPAQQSRSRKLGDFLSRDSQVDEQRASLEALNKLLSECSFVEPYAFRALSCGAGECELLLPYRTVLDRPGGSVNGPALMAAADVAMWLAIKTVRGIDDPSVTASMSTQFLKSSQREPFLCTATVMSWGRRTMFGTAECVSASGERLAFHTLTYVTP